ncbi:MAG: hypothetical protein H6620_07210 [Halobacteriovoraceae bacterium]|nr:hypothetical protein [Halobacteriovoraceae bacterium]
MKTLMLLSLTLFVTSCATKWAPKSSNPVAEENNTLKTDWGYIKVYYNKTTDEGMFFNIELKNESQSPVKYQRGYVSLQSSKGEKYQDLQNKYLGQNALGAVKYAEKGNKLGLLIAGAKSAWQSAKILGNGDIAPGALHTDRLIYGKDATKGKTVTLIFGPELVKDSNKNTISFSAE